MSEKQLSIQSSVFWNSAGSIFYLGCQWLITALVVKLSGVDAAGVLSLAMSVCNIWYCLAVYGMRNFQVSDTEDNYSNGSYIFSRFITCGLAMSGCLIFTLIMPYNAEQSACIILYFIYKCSEAFYDVYAGIFQRKWRLDYAGKSMFLRGFLSLGSFCIMLLLTDNITLTIGVMAALCLLSVLIFDVPIARKLTDTKLDTDFSKTKALLVKCSPLVIYTLMSSAIGSIPRLFLERITGSYELGIYSSVATPTLIIQMGATYIFNPFVTLFAERYHDKNKEGFMSAFKRCTLAVLVLAIAGIIGGKLLGHWGLNFMYGEEVAEYTELLIPLIICTILTAFAWLLCGVLTAIREFKGLIVGNLAAVIVSFILSPWLETLFKMQGASLALGLATLVEIIVLFMYMMKNLRAHFN